VRVNREQSKPGPRTEDGPAVGTPGSLFPAAAGKGKGVTVIELPERDTTVLVERAPGALSSPAYIGSGDLYGNVSDPLSGYWTESLSVTDATASWANLPQETRDDIDRIAKLKWPTATGEGLWEKAVKGSNASTKRGNPMSTFQWINAYAENLTGKSGGVSGGKYTGPVATRTVAAESDIRETADAVALEMLGRAVTDEEYQRILKRTRKAEQAQPQITQSGTGYSTTEQGLTAQGRQDIVQNILAKKPEYEEFQKATTLMSWFDEALSRRRQQNV